MIRVEAVSKRFGEVVALSDVSLAAERGEVIGVLGLNGAGKSTLLRLLAGELQPTSGRLRVAGHDLDAAPRAARAHVGYLPEGAPLYDDLRVGELLAFMGRLRGLRGPRLAARVAEVAAATRVTHQLHRFVGELSLGYRKRVGIAQALVHDPDVVILDEPVSALDPAEIVAVRGLIRALGGRHTVLVSSHILSEIHETCDRLVVLHRGEVVASGPEADLRARLHAGGQRLTLTVRGDEARLRAALPQGITLVAARPAGEGLITAELDDPDDRREALVAALVAAGLGVRALSERATDLEAVFLALVQGGEGHP